MGERGLGDSVLSEQGAMSDQPEHHSSNTSPPRIHGGLKNNVPSCLSPHSSFLIPRLSSLIFLSLWLFLLLAGRQAMFRDPGTYWHLAVGERMNSTGKLVYADSYSFTRADRPWIADQWLAECGMAAVHRLAGWDGLLIAAAALLAGVYAFIAARLMCGGLRLFPAVLATTFALALGAPQFHVRPLVFTFCLMTATFALLIDVEAGRKSHRWLWALVPLMVLWTNLHGGMLGGLATAGLCFAGWWFFTPDLRLRIRTALELSALFAACAAAMLVNPYGIALPRQWLQTLAMPLGEVIEEHAALGMNDPLCWGVAVLAAIYLTVLLGTLSGRVRIVCLVPLVWLALAILSARNAALFGVTAVLAIADMLPRSRIGQWLREHDWMLQINNSCNLPPSPRVLSRGLNRLSLGLPAAVVAGVFLLAIAAVWLPLPWAGWARPSPAVCPMELLPELTTVNSKDDRDRWIFNDLKFGGFLIYFAPRLSVFIDDRCPLYGTEFLLSYDRARREDPALLDRWREEYGFRYALVESGGRFDGWLAKSPSWRLWGRTPSAALYELRLGL
jgi:hypothetical protein